MHLKNVLLGCLAVATVTACSNEEVMEQASQAPTEVQFRIDQQAITKAVKVDFVEGDAIGIYAVERLLDDEQAAVPTGESRAINVKYVKDKDGNWKPATEQDKITWSDVPMDFYAYYPYSESAVDPSAIAVDVLKDKSDFLYAANTEGLNGHRGKEVVNLTFNHQLAMVEVLVPGLTKDDVVTMQQVKYSGSFSLATGELTAVANQSDVVLEYVGEDASKNAIFQGFLPAQSLYYMPSNPQCIVCKTATDKYVYNIVADFGVQLVKGEKKQFVLTLQ